MNRIISKLFKTVKDTRNFIEAEESMHHIMHEWFSEMVGDMLTGLDRAVKEKKQEEGWLVKGKTGKRFSLCSVQCVKGIDSCRVDISHQTVSNIVKQVDSAQAQADEVFIRGTEEKEGIEVSHAFVYEGWKTNSNGKRVALEDPTVIMTTQPISNFGKKWKLSLPGLFPRENPCDHQ